MNMKNILINSTLLILQITAAVLKLIGVIKISWFVVISYIWGSILAFVFLNMYRKLHSNSKFRKSVKRLIATFRIIYFRTIK